MRASPLGKVNQEEPRFSNLRGADRMCDLFPGGAIARTSRSNGSAELDARREPDGWLPIPGRFAQRLAVRRQAL